MNRNKLRQEIYDDEGMVLIPYTDTLGNQTIGVGHLIGPNEKFTIITEAAALHLFDLDLDKAILRAIQIYPGMSSWPSEVQDIIMNMSFQLGYKLRNFVKMNECLNRHDWAGAAEHGLDSRWAKQTPNRANRLMDRLRRVSNG